MMARKFAVGVLGSICCLLGFFAGRGGPVLVSSAAAPAHAPRVERTDVAKGPSSSPTAHGRDALCAGSISPIAASLTPAALTTDGDMVVMDVDFEIKNNFDKEVGFVTAVELVDSKGRSVHTPAISKVGRLAKGTQLSRAVKTPGGLKDGYYVLRATVAATVDDSSEHDVQTRELFLEVKDHTINSLPNDEWKDLAYADRRADRVKTAIAPSP